MPQEKSAETFSLDSEEDLGLSQEEVEAVKREYVEIFDEFNNGSERINELLVRYEAYLDSELLDGEAIRQALHQCIALEDKEVFAQKVFDAIRPLILFKKKYPEEFKSLRKQVQKMRWPKERERFWSIKDRIRVNEAVSYNIERNELWIHLAPVGDYGMPRVKKLFLEALGNLAEIIKGNDEVQTIVATSWIVAQHPKILEKLGFTIETKVNEDETRSSISREDFLRRYGNNP